MGPATDKHQAPTHRLKLYVRAVIEQGRRHVFKSGPAEEAIECRRHERGRAREGDYERGIIPPLDYSPSRKGGLGASPEKVF